MHPIYKFMLVFPVSIVSILFLLSLSNNDFVISFMISLVISILAVKEKNV